MAKKEIRSYRVRNKFHQILGEYPEKALLSKIHKGKFSGDEEIQEIPNGAWKKMASHNRFFEAFVRRIVDGPVEIETDQSQEKQKSGTRPEKILEENKEQGKTEHLGDVVEFALEEQRHIDRTALGGTLRKSDVDRLFENAESGQPGESLQENLLEKPLQDVEPEARRSFSALAEPLNPDKLRALARKLAGESAKRRRIFLVAALTFLLMLLFQNGGDRDIGNGDQTALEANGEKSGGLISEEERRESVAALTEEASAYYGYDSPIDYQAAAEISGEGLKLDGKNIILLSLHSLALVRSLEGMNARNETKDRVRSTINSGRELEPHRSAFYRAEALLALHEGSFDVAKAKSQESFEADPTDPENFGVSAEIAIARGDLSSANEQTEKGLKLQPNSIRLQHLAAQIALKRKNYEMARKYSGEVARLNPLHADSYSIVGEIQTEKNDLRNAKILFELTTRLGRFATPKALGKAHERLAKHYEFIGQPADKAKHERAALFYKDLNTGKSPSAEEKETVAEFYYDRTYFEDRGRELLRENNNRDALRFYQALRVLYPRDIKTMIKAGEVMEKLAGSYEDFRKVMLLYQRASTLDPKNPDPLVRLANLELKQYNFSRSLELLLRAEEVSPESADVKVAFGKFYFRRQDYVKARDYLSKAGTINPTNAEVYYYYGLLTRLYKPDLVKEASRHFYQAYVLDIGNYEALAEWLKLRVEEHDKNFAVKFIRNLVEADPKNAELYWVFGEVYAANKEARRAITYYHRSLDIDNRSSKVRMSLAKAHAAVGELSSAVEEYVLASRLDRRSPEGYFEAGQLLLEMKKMDFAEDVLRKLVSVTPNFPGAHRLLARVYQAKGKKELAIQAMGKEVENNPYNYKFTVEFAELFMSYEEYEKAISELKKVTGLPPESKAPEFRVERVRAYLLLSRCLRAQNKSESAEGAIKSAIQIDPTDPELKRELGYVYHSLQRDRESTEAFNYYLERNPAAQDADLIRALIKKMGTDE